MEAGWLGRPSRCLGTSDLCALRNEQPHPCTTYTQHKPWPHNTSRLLGTTPRHRAPAMELMGVPGKEAGEGLAAVAPTAIRSSEDGGRSASPPLPPPQQQLAIQAVQILSHRVRQPVRFTEAADPSGEEGLVRRLKRHRREGRPFVVYVLQVRWVG